MKKNIQKLLVVSLSVMFGFVMAACDGTNNSNSNSNDPATDSSSPVHEHSYTSSVTKEATCTEKGVMTYTCECGDSYTEEIATKAHELTHHAAVGKTCDVAGSVEHWVCEGCNAYYLDAEGTQATTADAVVVPASHGTLTHVQATAKTCTTAGNVEHWICEDCNDYFADAEGTQATTADAVVVPASHGTLTHVQATAKTCTTAGNVEHWICEDCNVYYLDEKATQVTTAEAVVVPASHGTLVHHEAVEATCEVDGNVEHWTCEDCNVYYLDAQATQATTADAVVIEKTGHLMGSYYISSVADGVAVLAKDCENCETHHETIEVAAPTKYAYKIGNDPEKYSSVLTIGNEGYSYQFVVDENGVWKNTNSGISNSVCGMTFTAVVDGILEFDLTCGTENPSKWDFVTVSKPFQKYGGAEATYHIVIELSAGETVFVKYEKDGSGDKNGDFAELANLTYEVSSIPNNAEYVLVNFDTNGGSEVNPAVAFKGLTLESLPAVEKEGYFFIDWYSDLANEVLFDLATPLTENTTIYAKWISEEDAIACFGTYGGYNVSGLQSVNNYNYLSVDAYGNTTGYLTGTISYNESTQTYSWTDGTKIKEVAFDPISGVLVVPEGYDNELGTDVYVFVKNLNETISMDATAFFDAAEEYSIKLVEYTINETTTTILLKDKTIYSNVTYSTIFDDFTCVDDIYNPSDIVIKDVNGNVLVAQGYNTDTRKLTNLDAAYGVYTNETNTLKVGGLGKLSLNEVEGTYVINEQGVLEAYIGDSFYHITLTEDTYSAILPMATITFVTGNGHTEVASQQFNINVPATLPVIDEDNYVFNGWYFDDQYTTAVPANYIPTSDDTLYAKFSTPAVVTVNPNNGLETSNIVYSTGEVTEIDTPIYSGYVFVGWYTTETFEEGTEWVNGEIFENVTIYAKWEVAPAYNKTYLPVEIDGTNSGSRKGSIYARTAAVISIDEYGNATGTGYPFRGTVTVANYDENTGYLTITVDTNTYYGYMDSTTGIIVLDSDYGTGPDSNGLEEVIFLTPFETTTTSERWLTSYWDNGRTRTITYKVNETEYNVFVYENAVYFGASFQDANGNAIAANATYNATTLKVYGSDNSLIAEFGYDQTTMVALDGKQGTYTNAEDTLVLDGIETITLNGVEGTYSISAEGSSYTIDVYLENSYYEVTLTGDTYTINKPMVEITFDAGAYATVESANVNKNINYQLPQPTNDDYIFRGWYLDSDFANVASNEFLPTENITLYAKWDIKVTLTVVYGNGLESQILNYGAGDTTAPVKPAFTNGKVFNGWYTDAEFTTEYTVGEITEDTTIYCNWMDAVAMYGDYVGFNLYGSGAKNTLYFNANASITADGTASGKKSGTVTGYDSETGVFSIVNGSTTYYAVYDETSGALAYAYGTNATGLGTDMYLFFNKTVISGEQSVNLGGSFNKLVRVNFQDGTSMDVLVMNNRIYGNVTWETTGYNSTYTPYTIGNATTYTIYDSEGNVLLSN